ncbi:hypothetical protein EYC59_00410 [Candidatus Saccharibacteria bacterium]|nr:MAG: hypothetical protein EYC59_00410 [Candidatus Saccharibacteria bacterium]
MRIHLRLRKPRVKFSFLLAVMALVGLISYVEPVNALSEAQLKLHRQGIYYFDEVACSPNGTSSGSAGTIAGFLDPAKVPEPQRSAFIKAAQQYNIPPGAVAGLYLTEQNGVTFFRNYYNGNHDMSVFTNIKADDAAWKPDKFKPGSTENGPWAVGNVGGRRQFYGPFQFGETEWGNLGYDGDGDGKKDAGNFFDEVYGAANYLSQLMDTAKGKISSPPAPFDSAVNTDEMKTISLGASYYNGESATEVDGRRRQYVYGDQVALIAAAVSSSTDSGTAGSTPTTPTTPTTGAPTATPTATPSVSTGGTTDSTKPIIALDPGHGADIDQYTDVGEGSLNTGLADREKNNQPEGADVMTVSKRVKAELEQAGYRVLLLRGDNEAVKKNKRVADAIAAKATLGVTIHSAEESYMNQVWPQRVGTYRQYGSTKVSITNEAVAKKSQAFAKVFADERGKAEGHSISQDQTQSVQTAAFTRDDVPSKGNVSLMQLWGQNIPWVYNEIAADQGAGLSDGLKQKYTDGLVASIKAAIPVGAAAASKDGCTSSGAAPAGGSFDQLTLSYAWPEYKGLTVDATPGWVNAYTTARAAGRYIGGTSYPGIDCGGFVTTLVVDSGFDKTYNYGSLVKDGAGYTPIQYTWLRENWQSLGMGSSIDTATLQKGDVAIRAGHTFIYVGDVPGFGSKIASASLDERAPMADTKQNAADGTFEWFRKK